MTDPRTVERFWIKVDRGTPDDCWPWLAETNTRGYGRFHIAWRDNRSVRTVAHRFAYELLVGPIPEGLTLDHLCRNPSCVNPAHLEPVTNRENILRGEGTAARNARKTHCVHGHLLDGDNLLIRADGGRGCRTCRRLQRRAQRARRAEAAA